ncbi:hypothetical protein ACNFIC_18205 [Pseudomonas sp. NY15463]|uniref:hypothetical protein n=1 Tax=Pseudomonas sp. NY15463 TaxID=3400361 RepID=UPI003A89D082
MAAHLDEAEKQILGALLVDFSERGFDSSVFRRSYEGPKISDLINAICTSDDISTVDFDLALKDLEKKRLIRTGPYKAYENRPGSGVMVVGGYSLREYAGLTEQGYRAAKQSPNRPNKSQRIVNNVHISGGNFNNMQLAAGEVISQKLETNSLTESGTLHELIKILETHGTVVTREQQADLESVIIHANDGDGKTAKSLLEKVCGPAWQGLQPVMWPIVGDLIKKSLGI